MVKTLPVWKNVSEKTFPTKGAAERFAIDKRKKKLASGEKYRYEVNYDSNNGGFKVTEFYWAQDEKGRLI